MKRAMFAVCCLTLVGAALPGSAQTPAARPAATQPPQAPGEVRGVITDGDANVPLARATVTVRTKPKGTLVTGAVAKDDGTFRIQGLRPGTYYIHVTSIGYGPKSSEDFTITPAALVATTAPVKLSKVAVALEGVQVTAERAAIAIEPDRNTYSSKQVAPTATNASDVLDAVPSVQVDGDGKVSLRGNENVAIQINGRPTPISGAQLGAYLKQIPATIVERVEVALCRAALSSGGHGCRPSSAHISSRFRRASSIALRWCQHLLPDRTQREWLASSTSFSRRMPISV